MSTPYDRAKPPRPAIPEIQGCRVCGADPTHFAPDIDPLVPLCDGCTSTPLAVGVAYAAGLVFICPIPPQFIGMLLFLAAVGYVVWLSTRND